MRKTALLPFGYTLPREVGYSSENRHFNSNAHYSISIACAQVCTPPTSYLTFLFLKGANERDRLRSAVVGIVPINVSPKGPASLD